MKIVCVDDEPNALAAVQRELEQLAEVSEVAVFLSPYEALAHMEQGDTDVALLDIDMGQLDGLSLAKRIREQSPRTRIVFLTGYAQYAVEAFKLHVSGYLLKPVTRSELEEELRYIRCQPPPQEGGKRVRVQCFGSFEVFVDGRPLKLSRSKTKELLAYLVDRRGAAANTGELCAVLWEDRADTLSLRNQLRTLLSDLSRSLKQVQAEDILIKRRNSFAIAVDKISCDYYDFLRGEAGAVNQYRGEYMAQYSWAEMTLGYLERQ